jgi:hypothetical protein
LPERITESRFQVATVTGFRITGSSYPSRAKGPGLSAHVVDTERNCEVVASFRSEDEGGHLGVEGALKKAHAEAERLNGEFDAAATA